MWNVFHGKFASLREFDFMFSSFEIVSNVSAVRGRFVRHSGRGILKLFGEGYIYFLCIAVVVKNIIQVEY